VAVEVYEFAVIIPASTPLAAPLTFNLGMPTRVVDEVEIVIPPGPRGEVGFQLGSGSSQIIPRAPGQFVVSDSETIHWPLEGQIDSGAWSLIAYNTGAFNHTIRVRFLVRLPPSQTERKGLTLLAAAALSQA
jgi:hypothetical protein